MQEVWLRRRANNHKDALRLILEPRFQIREPRKIAGTPTHRVDGEKVYEFEKRTNPNHSEAIPWQLMDGRNFSRSP